MHKDDFSMRLTAASYWAWRAIQRFVIDRLPPEFRYDLRLSNEPEKTDSNLRHWDVVDKVMKDDKVPVWIDMMVDRVVNGQPAFSVECSDRYESDASKLYYTWNGSAPKGMDGELAARNSASHEIPSMPFCVESNTVLLDSPLAVLLA